MQTCLNFELTGLPSKADQKRDLQAVVFLHGGPGSGTSSGNRQFFDPKFYRIILFDQVWPLLVFIEVEGYGTLI